MKKYLEKDLTDRKEKNMNKCNNCAKFLTCNREDCKQVTYLQAGQIDRVEAKEDKTND